MGQQSVINFFLQPESRPLYFQVQLFEPHRLDFSYILLTSWSIDHVGSNNVVYLESRR